MKEIQPDIFTGADWLTYLNKFPTLSNSSCFVLVDENTIKHCYPLIAKHSPQHELIRIPSGEENKTLQTCELIWNRLTEINADRNSLLINLGGGVICDMGGFAAGCYKRGIKFINIPTTLLAMVDASVGGKTGIDLMGYKNQIGLFNEPEAVLINTSFLQTLDSRQLVSGFAEIIKHYLIASKAEFDKLYTDRPSLSHFDFDRSIEKAIAIKAAFVKNDPHEKNERKALNFGHTIGHALESAFLNDKQNKLLHGEAVAIGMIAEGFISAEKNALSEKELETISDLISHYFDLSPIPVEGFPQILTLIKQDKKNIKDTNQFTLLQGIGGYTINNSVDEQLITESLNYYNSQLE